jgi:hypothetical protein
MVFAAPSWFYKLGPWAYGPPVIGKRDIAEGVEPYVAYDVRTVFVRCRVRCSVRVSRDVRKVRCDARTDARGRGVWCVQVNKFDTGVFRAGTPGWQQAKSSALALSAKAPCGKCSAWLLLRSLMQCSVFHRKLIRGDISVWRAGPRQPHPQRRK